MFKKRKRKQQVQPI